MANEHVMEFTDQNFETEVEAPTNGLVVVDFWAPWCGPCRMIAPIIEQLAKEYAGRVKFGKLNVDDNPETALTYSIRSIPTVGLFKDGQPLGGVVGAVPRQHLEKLIQQHLPAAA
jgi:thioredoxin 1